MVLVQKLLLTPNGPSHTLHWAIGLGYRTQRPWVDEGVPEA